jgi:hypothetical protein
VLRTYLPGCNLGVLSWFQHTGSDLATTAGLDDFGYVCHADVVSSACRNPSRSILKRDTPLALESFVEHGDDAPY